MKKTLSVFLLLGMFCISANAQTDSLKQYTGKYRFPDGSPVTEITMVIENGVLMGNSSIGNSEFKPSGTADVFEIVAYGGTATFKRKEGKVNAVQIEVQDVNLEGTKEENGFVIIGKDISIVLRK